MPKEEDFFKLFYEIANELVEASVQFQTMLRDFQQCERYANAIALHEEKADQITEITLLKLHKTFITPFDRYDIHRFVKKLDDVLDSINRTTKRIMIFKIKELPSEINSIAFLGVQATETIRKAIEYVRNMKNSTRILDLCDSIDKLETEAEHLLLSGISRLFQENIDCLELLKIKEIYEYSKSIIKNCQGVSNIIKDVVLEYS